MQKITDHILATRQGAIAKLVVGAAGPTIRGLGLNGYNTGMLMMGASAKLKGETYRVVLVGYTEAETSAMAEGVLELVQGAIEAYEADMAKYGVVLTDLQLAGLTKAVADRLIAVYPQSV